MRDIQGYNGRFKITHDGRVISFWGRPQKGLRETELKCQMNYLGYPIIRLGSGERKKTHYIHRLVACAFLSNPSNLKEINHKNGNKTDNRVSNLEWSTRSRNVQHAFDLGLKKWKRGEDHHRAKLADKEVVEIRERITSKYGALTKLAEEFNVSISLVSLIKKGHRMTA